MEVFSPFQIPYHNRNQQVNSSPVDDANLDLSDPDEMYAQWVAPAIDIFDGMTKEEWRTDISTIHEVYLELSKNSASKITTSLLKEMSIQVSIYEALIFREIIQNKQKNNWVLSKEQNRTHEKAFIFESNNTKISTIIHKNSVHFQQNNISIGKLAIDMESVLLEKIHGQLFDQPFILDPIWLKKQKKLDAVKLQIDQLKTEIVHKKHHKQTMWTGGNQISRMTISKNDSIHINKALILNIKKIHWQQKTLRTLQWYTPWVRFPVHGKFILDSD
ncbi:MAG: hypothetical protein ACON35_00550 [Candidatus Marinamargulisbacteria bacterium]